MESSFLAALEACFINFKECAAKFGFIITVTLLVIYLAHCTYRWSHPRCSSGVLPPGSAGVPIIGETLQLLIPTTESFGILPFLSKRIKRYGPIFRTNIAGRNIVITADPEINSFLLRKDAELMKTWVPETFTRLLDIDDDVFLKYFRILVLNHLGLQSLKEKLPQLQNLATEALEKWSDLGFVEVKEAAVAMMINFSAPRFFSINTEDFPVDLSKMYNEMMRGINSFPLNFPGTAYHSCWQIHRKVKAVLKDILQKRLEKDGDERHVDLLDHIIKDMKSNTKTPTTQESLADLMFLLLFVVSGTVSSTLALAFKLLAEHPAVLQELTAEHEAILKVKEDVDAPISWDEYKSMTFTMQVVNEILRLANFTPGIFRRATKDIHVNEYVIPRGWGIVLATSAVHLNANQFQDPLQFNPSGWKNIQPGSTMMKSLLPFGSGIHLCPGAEYSKVALATILHVLVTKYRWTMAKDAKCIRTPMFIQDGFYFSISKKTN